MAPLASIESYEPLAWLVLIVVAMAGAMFGAAHMLGPHRMGPTKGTPYEAGVLPIGSARTRFDIRFYMVAMIFLLFDVEVALLWPWAPLFADAGRQHPRLAATREMAQAGLTQGYLFGVVAVFVAILLIGYVYVLRKGVFKFS